MSGPVMAEEPSVIQTNPLVPGFRDDRIAYKIQARSVDVEMLDAQSSSPVPLYAHHGWRFALTQPGQTYKLKITNRNSEERVMVKLSIDDLNPRNGKKAYIGQSGYVIDPGQTVIVTQIYKGKNPPLPLTIPQELVEGKHGEMGISVFRESLEYPYPMPWSIYQGQTNMGSVKVVSGQQQWFPPQGARFRYLSQNPEEIIPLFYEHTPKMLAKVKLP